MLYNKRILYVIPFVAICAFSNTARAQYALKQARDAASVYNYVAAKQLYTKAYEKKKTIEAARSLAEIYAATKDYVFAESWWAKVVAMPGHTPEDKLHYAEALINNSKYSEAEPHLQQYLSAKPDDKVAQNMLSGAQSAGGWIKSPVKGSLENMQVLNTACSDWGLVKQGDRFVFASDRPYDSIKFHPLSSRIRQDKYMMTGNSYLHLYQSDGKDSSSTIPLKNINGDYHTASAAYTADGKEMYYAETRYVKKKSSFLGKDEPYTLNVAILKNVYNSETQAWGKPADIPYNQVLGYSVGDPYISPDGNTLVFVAEKGVNHVGGTDIYYTQKDINGIWQPPVNMGRDINTEGNERTPFFDEAGNFYFASDGRIGLGGLDIYKAVKNPNGGWSVTNMGCPVNSAQDDFAPFFTSKNDLYFSSNRIGGKGSDDIYYFNIARILLFNIDGSVLDQKTRLPLPNTVVTVLNKTTNTIEKTVTDDKGHFAIKLDSLTDYEISLDKSNYASVTGIPLSTKGLDESKDIRKTLYMSGITVNKPVKLNNIYFDFDKWDIRPDAASDLDSLVKLLNDNPTWKIEMSSHTDSRGKDGYNMKLSQKRAESTVSYLIAHGIAADRLTAKGYGESRPVNGCVNGVACTEAQYAENRRTEFMITDK